MNLSAWQAELASDNDRDFLLDGIENGFKIVNHEDTPTQVKVTNYKSANQNSEAVEQQILTEIRENRYIMCNKPVAITSALGAIPKSDSGVRLIHDCSRPQGQSVNDYVKDRFEVKYQSVQSAIQLVKSAAFMAKVDLQSAYRSVGLHPSQYQYTGIEWTFKGDSSPTYMFDSALPFGASLSPGIFHRLTQAVCRIMKRKGHDCIAYLDDFFVTGPTWEDCNSTLHLLLKTLRHLGFAIAYKKIEGPSQSITFLGVNINSVAMSLSLPGKKVEEYKILLASFNTCSRASRRQLERLAGKLAWAAHVVQGGRIYLQRVLAIIRQLKRPHHKVLLSDSFHKDVKWWLEYIEQFNCTHFIIEKRPTVHVYTDASQEAGGIVSSSDWCYINWQEDLPQIYHMHINVKETVAVICAVYRWAPTWRNCNVVMHTDNMTARAAISKGKSNNELIMDHIRQLFWLSQVYNFSLNISHVKGSANLEADCVSRLSEKGQLPYWLSIISGGSVYTEYEVANWLLQHCTIKSASYLFSQRHKLLPWLFSWTKQWQSIRPSPLQHLLEKHTRRI